MGGKGRDSAGDGGGSGGGGGDGGGGGGHVCTLVPGATATFEVAATAPAEVADGTVRMEVRAFRHFIDFYFVMQELVLIFFFKNGVRLLWSERVTVF